MSNLKMMGAEKVALREILLNMHSMEQRHAFSVPIAHITIDKEFFEECVKLVFEDNDQYYTEHRLRRF